MTTPVTGLARFILRSLRTANRERRKKDRADKNRNPAKKNQIARPNEYKPAKKYRARGTDKKARRQTHG